MNQSVPDWDFEDNYALPGLNLWTPSNSSSSLALDVPSLDYEVAELTWENGQLAMRGLGPPRVATKPVLSSSPTTWDKPRAGDTLEPIVNQATRHPNSETAAYGGGDNATDPVPGFDQHRAMTTVPSAATSVTMTTDALVPCNNQECSAHAKAGTRTCTAAARAGCNRTASMSLSESGTRGGDRARRRQAVTVDTYDRELCGAGFTPTSFDSPGNTSSGKEYTKISAVHEQDSVCHSRSQREAADHDEGNKKSIGKSSVSTKRSRAAAVHNQSERKRRDKINQRMKTLQKMVPYSSKTDKASMLDEVIEHLKQLQAHVQMMSRMGMSPMMLPLAMHQQLQMSMMGMGMGMGGMDLNTSNRVAGMQPVIPPAAAFMPVTSWPDSDNPVAIGDRLPASMSMMPDPMSTFLACQSQSMIMDTYSRLASLYQQFQQQQQQMPHNTDSKD